MRIGDDNSGLGFTVEGVLSIDILVKTTGEDYFDRKKLGGFGAGIANHDSLIAGTTEIDTLGDFGALGDEVLHDLKVLTSDALDDLIDVDIFGS